MTVRWNVIGIDSILFSFPVEGKLFPELKYHIGCSAFIAKPLGECAQIFAGKNLVNEPSWRIYVAVQSSMRLQVDAVRYHTASQAGLIILISCGGD